MTKLIAIGGLAAMVLSGVALAGCTTTKTEAQIIPEKQTIGISVSASGKAIGVPDVAIVTLGVTVERDTVAAAREDAAQLMAGVTDSLKSNGVKKEDIQTLQFSVYPVYDYNRGAQTLRGYSVSNVVSAKIRNIDNTSKVLDDATAAGGDEVLVQGVTFTIDNTKALENEARKQAMDEAKAKAETLAKQAGVSLGKPLAISEGVVSSPVVMRDAYATKSAGSAESVPQAPTPIEQGQETVEISVQVTYAID